MYCATLDILTNVLSPSVTPAPLAASSVRYALSSAETLVYAPNTYASYAEVSNAGVPPDAKPSVR